MTKHFEAATDFLPITTQRQQIEVIRPKLLPGLYDWLRFGVSRDVWVELFGLDLEQIDEQAATIYLEEEAKYLEGLAEDFLRVIGTQRVFALRQRKLEWTRGRFIHAATQLCGKMEGAKRSPIEQILLTALLWEKYLPERKPAEIWDSTSGLGRPQAEVVIAPQYQTRNHRIDLALFINIFANEEIKIAVECDGHDFHEKTPDQAARDKERNGDLQIVGWRLLRFTGRQIRREPKRCAARVAELAKNEIDAQLKRRGLIL
jgi:hypothetical protein